MFIFRLYEFLFMVIYPARIPYISGYSLCRFYPATIRSLCHTVNQFKDQTSLKSEFGMRKWEFLLLPTSAFTLPNSNFRLHGEFPLTMHILRMGIRRSKQAFYLNTIIYLFGKCGKFGPVHFFAVILVKPSSGPCLLGRA